MNDAMSFGMHRNWKAATVRLAMLRQGMAVLDVATGSGDLALAIAKQVLPDGQVTVSDINAAMLAIATTKLIDNGFWKNVAFVAANAEKLPFETSTYDVITIAFGLRNVARIPTALQEFLRVLKPGGRLLVTEFSKPVSPVMQTLYDKYSFNIIPRMGAMIAKDRASYQYLVESIRMHPDQQTLQKIIEQQGFVECGYTNLTGGIAAIHTGYKPY